MDITGFYKGSQNKMHRVALENNLRREYDVEGLNGTPIRGGLIGLPRRLLALDFEPISDTRNILSSNSLYRSFPSKTIISTGIPYQDVAVSFRCTSRRNFDREQFQQSFSQRWSENFGDRFIPRRRGANNEASHYYHTCRRVREKDGSHLDVFEEVKQATDCWRRVYMDNAFRKMGLFDGLELKRVLHVSQSLEHDSFDNMKTHEFDDDCQWKCHPRKQPLMNLMGDNYKHYRDYGAQIFRFAMSVRFRNVIDWSSKNILAAGLANAMCICDMDYKNMSNIHRIDHSSYLCNLKWNSKGTQIAMNDLDGFTNLFDAEFKKKIIWSIKCPCYAEKKCSVNCTIWAKKDKHIITSCDEGTLNIINSIKGIITTSKNFERQILAISLSPKEQYIAVSGMDRLVKVFEYPSLHQLFEIAFFASVKAFAWHPWTPGVLCIGGGPGDASLSLWNVNNQSLLGYRKVRFVGSVDRIMFNNLSGELLVHWFYLENDRLRSKIAILADLDRIVDALPIQPEHRILNIMWSPDNTRLAMQHRDTLVVWNFFGNESHKWIETAKKSIIKDPTNNLRNYSTDIHTSCGPFTGLAHARRGNSLSYYTIR